MSSGRTPRDTRTKKSKPLLSPLVNPMNPISSTIPLHSQNPLDQDARPFFYTSSLPLSLVLSFAPSLFRTHPLLFLSHLIVIGKLIPRLHHAQAHLVAFVSSHARWENSKNPDFSISILHFDSYASHILADPLHGQSSPLVDQV